MKVRRTIDDGENDLFLKFMYTDKKDRDVYGIFKPEKQWMETNLLGVMRINAGDTVIGKDNHGYQVHNGFRLDWSSEV